MADQRRNLILVIDDTAANRYVLCRLLVRAGYDVLEATSIAEAEALLPREPDLVVCDVNLPDGKGTAFTQRIKAREAPAPPLVLNMSASYTRTRDRVDGLDSGADGYLVQPIDPHEFLATVASLLRIRMAEETVRRKNRELELFAHAVSHDLQEPLRMVTSYLDLLERSDCRHFDPKQEQYLNQVRIGATRMRRIVSDLVALTILDQRGIQTEPVDVRDVVQDAMTDLMILIHQHNPRVEIGGLPRVMGDRGLLTQVFQNLLSNAIKYRSSRPLTIAISGIQESEVVTISVMDNGIGIAADAIDGIFAAFKRLHAHDEIPGSGIGLALCKKVVELHGGTIGCTSREGEGSSFWITLPAAH